MLGLIGVDRGKKKEYVRIRYDDEPLQILYKIFSPKITTIMFCMQFTRISY